MKRIFPLAVGAALVAFAGAQSYAFMLASVEATPSSDATDAQALVAGLEESLSDASVECETKLESVESAIENIDLVLDAGTADEDVLLNSREALVEMRKALPCSASADTLVHDVVEGNVISDTVVSETIVEETVIGTEVVGTPVTSYSTGGFVSSGGGGGGGGFGGAAGVGGGRFGLIAAVAAGIAIPIAVSDDDDDGPGIPASPMAP